MLTGNSLIRQRLDDLIGEGELHWDEFKANGKGVIQDSMQFAQSSGSSNPYSLPSPHGFTTAPASSSKCLTLRVARVAWLARTMEAIIVSRSPVRRPRQ